MAAPASMAYIIGGGSTMETSDAANEQGAVMTAAPPSECPVPQAPDSFGTRFLWADCRIIRIPPGVKLS